MKYSNLIKRLIFYSIAFTSCFYPVKIYSQQAGTIDSTFGNNGVIYCETNFGTDAYSSIVSIMDSQDRILTLFIPYNDSCFFLVRHLMNGKIDKTFGNDGKMIFEAGVPIYCSQLIAQQDDKILVGGSKGGDFFVARFLQNGSLDNLFGNQGKFIADLGQDERIDGLILQEDGMILVSGNTGFYSWSGSGNREVVLMRLLPNGTTDNTFGVSGIVITDLSLSSIGTDLGGPLALQSDGKILMAAKNGFSVNEQGYASILRYESNGTLDSSFGNKGIFIDTLSYCSHSYCLTFLDNGKILLAGGEGDYFGGGFYFVLSQFTSDGVFDTKFATNGKFKSSEGVNGGRALNALRIQNDGKIIATGRYGGSLILMRFAPQGEPDTTFAAQGMTINRFDGFYFSGDKVYLSPNDKITVLGVSNDEVWRKKVFIARYHNDLTNAIPKEESVNKFNAVVYPNPVADKFSIELSRNYNKVDLSITDITGKIIYTTTATETQKIEVNTSDFANGIYLVQVQTSDFIETKKVVVEK